MRRVLEILTYLATNHSGVASLLFHFEDPNITGSASTNQLEADRGKNIITGEEHRPSLSGSSQEVEIPLILLLRLLGQPLFLQSTAHLEQVSDTSLLIPIKEILS